ncbi:hypothetical protein J4216_01080 [Candidatus Woesearchaeota archaeon]|nr:hypothetical protein [Candidatus Woesearchaeota archaeon]
MVSYVVKEKTKYFQAGEPHLILDYIDEREKNLKKTKLKVENILPELLRKQGSVNKSEVRVFEGFKGMISVHEKTYEKLKRGEEYYYLGIPAVQPKYFHPYYIKDHARRARAGIKCKLLFEFDTNDEVLNSRNRSKGCDSRRMPTKIKTPAWFMSYKDVAVIGIPSSTLPITIEITNKEVADSFRNYFEEFWKLSKPFKAKL